MNIRPLITEDAARYQALRLEALATEPTAFGSSHEEEVGTPLDAVAARLAPGPDAFMLGAFDGPALVGMVGLGREGMRKLRHKGFVWGMYVAPSHRGQGLGQALVEQALARVLAKPEIQRVNLFVNARNHPAIRLYERCGFEAYGTEPQAMWVEGVFQDELLMSWRKPATA